MSSNYEPILVSNREIIVTPVTGPSPKVPKRQARMELSAINLNNPSIKVTPTSPKNKEATEEKESSGQVNPIFEVDYSEDEEVFEEIEVPLEEKSKQEEKTTSTAENTNASSAFDSDTFYV